MKKLFTRLLISLVIGAGMVYLATRKVDFSTTMEALRDASWGVLVPYFLAMAVQHWFRAWRWSFLLRPIEPVPMRRILPVASVGFLAIVSLPLRMGELVRPYLIADPPRIRMSHGLGTMAVERVFDGLILSLVTFIAVAEARTRADAVVPGWIMAAGLIAFCLFLAVLVAAVMALWQRDRAVELCRRLFSIISPKLGDKLAKVAAGIVDGFKVLPNFRLVTWFIFATCAYWFFNGFAIWRLAHGFGMDLSFWGGIGVLVIVGIGIMIPAGPAFAGNFELFAAGALGLYLGQDIIAQKGAAYILTFHVTNFGWYAVVGFLSMFSKEVSFTRAWEAVTKDDKEEEEEEEEEEEPDEEEKDDE